MTRAQIIAEELLRHGTVTGPQCHCGHKYRAGDSIADHRAEAIDIVLTLHEAGVAGTELNRAAVSVFSLTETQDA